MKFRLYSMSALSVAMAIAFLVHFAIIATQGFAYIQEPSSMILYVEIAGFCLILAYALWNMISGVKK